MNKGNSPLEDLILNDSFRRWILKKDPIDEVYWNDWLKENADRMIGFLEAKDIVRSLHLAQEEISDNEVEVEVRTITGSLFARQEKRLPQIKFGRRGLFLKAAAALILLFIMPITYLSLTDTNKHIFYDEIVYKSAVPLVEVVNDSRQSKFISLPDGTSVILAIDSKISYSTTISKSRNVYLDGEAFFEVAKNYQVPFLVYANGLVSKVLGTSFTIKAYKGENVVKVIVKTGEVSVFSQNDHARIGTKDEARLTGLVIQPNHQVVYDRNHNRLTTSITDLRKVDKSSIQNIRFNFYNTPVAEVFMRLETTYGVPIVFNRGLLSECRITADLGDEPLVEKMNLICKALNGSFKLTNGAIIFIDKGCK